VIGLIIIVSLLLYWAFRGGKEEAKPVVAEKAAPVVHTPDDLVIIEGIGPKIAAILKENGIATFAKLAATDVAKLEQILRDNKLQFAKPDSWPEQAKLAAEGKMDELKELQEKLVAGR
jgi:predicted flap endonuclease-1-like 5' DNA nuclease